MTPDRDEVASKITSKRQLAGLTRAQLIEGVSRVVQVTGEQAAEIVEVIISSMVRALQHGERIEIRGFGSFHTRQRGARTGRNPKTGSPVEVGPKKIPFFKAGRKLRALLKSNAGES